MYMYVYIEREREKERQRERERDTYVWRARRYARPPQGRVTCSLAGAEVACKSPCRHTTGGEKRDFN